MYNLKQIKEDLRCIDAAESLGVKIQKRGNSYSMLCPAHNDRHFGSCYVYDKKWKCFACGAGGDVYSLIHEVTNLTNSELFAEAARLTGNPDKYLIGDKEQEKYSKKIADFPFTNEELNLIGLSKNFLIENPCNVGDFNEETRLTKMGHQEDNGHDVTLYGNYVAFNIIDMYADDSEFMKLMIHNKAVEREETINRLLNASFANLPFFDAETVYLLKNELKINLIKVRNIIRKAAA